MQKPRRSFRPSPRRGADIMQSVMSNCALFPLPAPKFKPKGGRIVALYRCSFQNITRSEGRSAVAAAAYRAGEKVTNEWDGVTHDFTKKQGVVHKEILLPPGAPVEYSERSYLWNAVETSEKSTRARLCRECLLALPVELSREQQIHLVRDYVEQMWRSTIPTSPASPTPMRIFC